MPTHNSPLIIAGMHRSGTSLVANWLSNCGLDVGEKLVRADFSNVAGHYEDWAFLDLHRDILAANHTDHLIADRRKLSVGPDHRARAEHIIAERTGREAVDQWGWKEPRTTVLLDFWHSLLPEMKVLVVYRHYAQVADSMLRRDLNRRRSKPNWPSKALRLRARIRLQYSFVNVPLARTYLRVWNRYNRDAVDFARAHQAQTLVLRVDDVLANGDAVITYLNQAWGYRLQAADTREVYDPALMQSGAMPFRAAWSALLAPACHITYRQLDGQRRESLKEITSREVCRNHV
jgi:hypothetical protein